MHLFHMREIQNNTLMKNYDIWFCFSTRQLRLAKQLRQRTRMDTTGKILMKMQQDVAEEKGRSRKTSNLTTLCGVL